MVSTEIRQTFQHELVQARVKESNTKISTGIKWMTKNQAHCLLAAKIRKMTGNVISSQGIPQVIAPNDEEVEV